MVETSEAITDTDEVLEEGDHVIEVESRLKSGASWFYWLAGLSLVNSIIALAGGDGVFIFGLGATQVIDAIVQETSKDAPEIAATVSVVGLVVNAAIAAIFVLFGWVANRRYRWAFYVGLVLYFLDALLFLFVEDYWGLAFHGWVLFALFRGLRACQELQEIGEVRQAVEPYKT